MEGSRSWSRYSQPRAQAACAISSASSSAAPRDSRKRRVALYPFWNASAYSFRFMRCLSCNQLTKANSFICNKRILNRCKYYRINLQPAFLRLACYDIAADSGGGRTADKHTVGRGDGVGGIASGLV